MVSPAISHLVQNPSSKICPLERPPRREEIFMFAILRDDAVSQTAGRFITKFWTHDVLQATKSYPAIWHAGLAMAAAHQKSQLTGQSETAAQLRRNYITFSLEHYNASIRLLVQIAKRKTLSQRDRETLLIASILFLSLCALQDDVQDAVIHAQSGAKLYQQWQIYDSRMDAVRNGILSRESLKFLTTTLKCALIEPIQPTDLESKSPLERRPHSLYSPIPFRTLAEAYMEFLPLLENIIDQGGSANCKHVFEAAKDNPSTWNVYRREYAMWRAKFNQFRAQWTPSDGELDCFLELDVYARLFGMMYDEVSAASEMIWDAYTDEFNHILDMAEQIYELRTEASAKDGEQQGGLFTLSLAPGEALAFMAASCRDYKVRRRTIALLKKWKWRNGVWDTRAMAASCETLMAFEENAKSADDWCECINGQFICHGHRVASTKAVFVGESEIVVRIQSVNDVRTDKPGIEYVLQN